MVRLYKTQFTEHKPPPRHLRSLLVWGPTLLSCQQLEGGSNSTARGTSTLARGRLQTRVANIQSLIARRGPVSRSVTELGSARGCMRAKPHTQPLHPSMVERFSNPAWRNSSQTYAVRRHSMGTRRRPSPHRLSEAAWIHTSICISPIAAGEGRAQSAAAAVPSRKKRYLVIIYETWSHRYHR